MCLLQGRPLDESFCAQTLGSSRLLCSAAVVFIARVLDSGSSVTSVHFRSGKNTRNEPIN